MIHWTANLIAWLGYGGVAILMLIEDVVLPIPSEVIMPVAGLMAARYGLSIWGVVAAGTAGSVMGGLPWYYLGRWIGTQDLPAWLARRGANLHAGKLRRAETWFAQRGGPAVLVARLLPGIRSLIGVPAGMAGMRLAPFLLFSLVGTFVWTGALAFAGRLIAPDVRRVSTVLGSLAWIVGAAALAFAAWFLTRHHGTRDTGAGVTLPAPSSDPSESPVAREVHARPRS